MTVVGAALPVSGPSILSSKTERHGTQYVLREATDAFIEEVSRNGATVLEATPISLSEIFFELCQRGESSDEVETR